MHERHEIATAESVLAKYGMPGIGPEGVTVEHNTRRLTVPVSGGAKLLAEIIRDLDGRGIEIDDIGLRRPTLDDVFITLTGHAAEEAAENGADPDGGSARSKKQKRRTRKQKKEAVK